MTNFTNYRDYVGSKLDKFYKNTIFHGNQLMIGINCFEPGQTQAIHDHTDQDKVYIVMEGHGFFTVDNESREAGPGQVILAAAGIPHGVENRSQERLVVLVCMAPPPKK